MVSRDQKKLKKRSIEGCDKGEEMALEVVTKKKKKDETLSNISEIAEFVGNDSDKKESDPNRYLTDASPEINVKKKKKKKSAKERTILEKESIKAKKVDEAIVDDLTKCATSPNQTGKRKKKKSKEANKVEVQNSGDEEIIANLDISVDSKIEKKNKKKRNKEKTTEENAEEDKKSASKLACDYLHEWKNHRSKWHFQKVRQVWLLQHMYSTLVSDDDFEVMLEYLEDLKGHARTKTLADAEKLMKMSEETDNADDADDAGTSLKVERARQLIQLLG